MPQKIDQDKQDFSEAVSRVKERTDCRELYERHFNGHFRSSGNSLCAWHEDANGSLKVTQSDCYCFACGKKFDALDIVMKATECDFMGALRILAQEVGVTLPKRSTASFTSQNSCNTATVDVEQGPEPAQPLQGGMQRSCNSATVSATVGCTLQEYADSKGLPVEFLKSVGVAEQKYLGAPAVRIAYFDAEGQERCVRYRVSMTGDKFRWRKGSKPLPYGLNRTAGQKAVVLVEGESDCHTLWFAGIPAVGLPGASTLKPEWDHFFDGVEIVYVVVEPDRGGETLKKLIAKSGIKDRVRIITMPQETKDTSALFLSNPHEFHNRWGELVSGAVLWSEIEVNLCEGERKAAWDSCSALARDPDILGRFVSDIRRLGVVGEERIVKIIFLAITSRVLERPVSVAVKGPSSGGKSFTTESVLSFFPETAYYALSGMSERALAYSEEPLQHRFLVIYEAAGMGGDFATYLMRSLLSEGRIRYEVVEKTSEGIRPRLIEREGPTGLLVTTTQVRLHPENETRLLSLMVSDSKEQTRSVLNSLADEGRGTDQVDIAKWHALQRLIERSDCRVTIPFASALAERIPPLAVRLRRDFMTILSLVRAHAILHQFTRDRNTDGRIVATFDDYEAVRALVSDHVSEGLGSTVSPATRETVEAVARLAAQMKEPSVGVTLTKIAQELSMDKSAVSRRVAVAVKAEYLVNLEDRRGKPGRFVIGDPLPGNIEVLPTVAVLQKAKDRCATVETHNCANISDSYDNRCSVAVETGGIKNTTLLEDDEMPQPDADGWITI